MYMFTITKYGWVKKCIWTGAMMLPPPARWCVLVFAVVWGEAGVLVSNADGVRSGACPALLALLTFLRANPTQR